MKKWLLIWLLILLGAQSSGYLFISSHEVCLVSETDDKTEKYGKEKKEKEYVAFCAFRHAGNTAKRVFGQYDHSSTRSHLPGPLTPPPDQV